MSQSLKSKRILARKRIVNQTLDFKGYSCHERLTTKLGLHLWLRVHIYFYGMQLKIVYKPLPCAFQ